MKKHRIDYNSMEQAPDHVKEEWRLSGLKPSICGYVRKKTTNHNDEVTCFYCRNILRKIANI